LVSAAAQAELWTEPKGLAQVEPNVRTKPRLRPSEKFDFTFWLISGLTWFFAQPKGSATNSASVFLLLLYMHKQLLN